MKSNAVVILDIPTNLQSVDIARYLKMVEAVGCNVLSVYSINYRPELKEGAVDVKCWEYIFGDIALRADLVVVIGPDNHPTIPTKINTILNVCEAIEMPVYWRQDISRLCIDKLLGEEVNIDGYKLRNKYIYQYDADE